MNNTDDLSVFDNPPRGLGHDGFVHSDPYCAMIAPIGSPEYRRGEMCEMCVEREDANEDMRYVCALCGEKGYGLAEWHGPIPAHPKCAREDRQRILASPEL